jgi:hypothetical protein
MGLRALVLRALVLEARRISERTRAALAAAKARAARTVRRAKANATTKVVVEDIRRSGRGNSGWHRESPGSPWDANPCRAIDIAARPGIEIAGRLIRVRHAFCFLPLSVEGVDVGTAGVPFISVRVDLGSSDETARQDWCAFRVESRPPARRLRPMAQARAGPRFASGDVSPSWFRPLVRS